jgi:hypothetical protein
VTSFDVGSGYININTPEDIMIAESSAPDGIDPRQVGAKDLA